MLDELVPRMHEANAHAVPQGTGPHPHRGFTTFTYLIAGELEHEDSFGHKENHLRLLWRICLKNYILVVALYHRILVM